MSTEPSSPRSPVSPLRVAFIGITAVLMASALVVARPAAARSASGPQLARLLRSGGYVIVMRHGESPLKRPRPQQAAPGNVHDGRQLNAAGIAAAKAIGKALRALAIPIGPIYSSPTFRARETIRLAGLHPPTLVPQLAESARGMAVPVRRSRAEWLRNAVRHSPPPGTNTLIVTHTPNIVGAFGRPAMHTRAAEMLVFRPYRGHAARFVGRIRPAEWRTLVRHRRKP